MDITILYQRFLECDSVSTDTRKISPRAMFFCLKGDNFNANDFALKAIDSGALYALVDEDRAEFAGHQNILHTDDVLKTMQTLATYHRQQLNTPIIALTGSNGKTTTKELLFEVLRSEKNCLATLGNLNNHIGVPLTLLRLRSEHEVAIVEMGANHQKEIEFLCTLAQPDIGFIINIGLAHLEGFGGEEGVFKGKKEMYDYIRAHNKQMFVNADDQKVVKAAANYPATTFGAREGSDYTGHILKSRSEFLNVRWLDPLPVPIDIETHLTGDYNFSNIMAAISIGHSLGISVENIKTAIEGYRPSNHRSQLEHTTNGNVVLVDCYNANPTSMAAAIRNLSSSRSSDKFVILGDMLELGEASSREHQSIVDLLHQQNINGLLIGPHFSNCMTNKLTTLNNVDEARDYVQQKPLKGKHILLKGSRSMRLENVLDVL